MHIFGCLSYNKSRPSCQNFEAKKFRPTNNILRYLIGCAAVGLHVSPIFKWDIAVDKFVKMDLSQTLTMSYTIRLIENEGSIEHFLKRMP